MKFKFSLQTVLDVRHTQVEALEIQLGQLNRTRLELSQLLDSLENVLVELLNGLYDEQRREEMDLFFISHLHQNIQDTEKLIIRIQEDLKVLDQKIEDKRQELVAAKQNEEVMEILKEKEHFRLLEAVEDAEKREVDDLYISRAFRMNLDNKV